MSDSTFHPPARSWTAAELRRLPPEQRDAILADAAALAEEDYNRNSGLAEIPMSDRVRELLASFDALPDSDKQAVAAEILRRAPEGDVPESALHGLADELFTTLDAEEAARADR